MSLARADAVVWREVGIGSGWIDAAGGNLDLQQNSDQADSTFWLKLAQVDLAGCAESMRWDQVQCSAAQYIAADQDESLLR